ncbi:MAG: YkgJ family cysteine cluster protein [Bryobacteraceae bacterium]|jgi:Fe-S-cluster containining protein
MPDAAPGRVWVPFELDLGQRTIEASAEIPDAPMRVADLLPVLLSFDGAVVEMVADQVRAAGKIITCGLGCGACCRQIVPISEAEALYLAELVGAMPAERQARVRERFRDALAAAGESLLSRLRDTSGCQELEARLALHAEYFGKRIACPFLEEESCSIYEHRPMTCREYLVTSPAVCCWDPRPGSIEPVPMPLKLSVMLYCFGDGIGNQPTRWLPLLLALEWAERHAGEPVPCYPAPQMFRNFVRRAEALARCEREDAAP